ncbi:MAG TPA: metal ABC transporter permease [Chloroflexota bacterium]
MFDAYGIAIMATGALVAGACAFAGCFLVLRRMALLGDAIGHSVLLGIVLAFLITHERGIVPMFVGAAVVGLLTAAAVQALQHGGVRADAAIGVTFTALFALGVVLLTLYAGDVHLDLEHVLYGEIAYAPWDVLTVGDLALGPKSLWVLGVVTVLDLLFVVLCYKELKLATFDPGLAAVLGFSPALVHYLLMAAVSVTTVAAFDAVGAVLVVALLIVPPATAYLLTDRLSIMLLLAVAIGALSGVLGYLLARALDASIAGAMATVAGALFGVAVLGSPRHGVVAWLLRQARLRRQVAADLLVIHLASQEQRGAAVGASVDALRARFRWSPSFTRAVVDEVLKAGLAERDGVAGAAETTSLVVTDRGRARAAELLAR